MSEKDLFFPDYLGMREELINPLLGWLQSLKQFFIDVSYHILVASLNLMALSNPLLAHVAG